MFCERWRGHQSVGESGRRIAAGFSWAIRRSRLFGFLGKVAGPVEGLTSGPARQPASAFPSRPAGRPGS